MHSLPGVTCVLFDLDGTLVESTAALHDAFNHFAADCGVVPDAAMVARFDGLSTHEIVDRAVREWRIELPVEAVRRKYFDRLASAYGEVKPAPCAHDVLASLRTRGRRLGLVTSAAGELVSGLTDRLGWRQTFDAMVCGEAGRKGKPHSDPYRTALRLLGLAAESAVAVEDSVTGIRSAHSAGLRVIAIAKPHRQPIMLEAGAAMTIGSLDEILSILE